MANKAGITGTTYPREHAQAIALRWLVDLAAVSPAAGDALRAILGEGPNSDRASASLSALRRLEPSCTSAMDRACLRVLLSAAEGASEDGA